MGSLTSQAPVETSVVKSVDPIGQSEHLSNAPISETSSNIALPVGDEDSSTTTVDLEEETDLPYHAILYVRTENNTETSTSTSESNESSDRPVAVLLAASPEVSNVDFSSMNEDFNNHRKEVFNAMKENNVSEEYAKIMVALDTDFNNAQRIYDSGGILASAIDDLYTILDGKVDDYPDGLRDVLYPFLNVQNKDLTALKLICRAAVQLLHFNNVYEPESMVGQALEDVIKNRIGEESYVDSETGITVSYPKNMNWENQSNTIDSVLLRCKALPEFLRNQIKSIHFYDTFNPYDLYWESVYNDVDFTAAASCSGGEVSLFAFSKGIDMGVLLHELAHSYDYNFDSNLWGIQSDYISSSSLWTDACKTDYETSGRTAVTEYARTAYAGTGNYVEDFAESIALYYAKPYALNQFPARKAILDQYLSQDTSLGVELGYEIFCDFFRKNKTEEEFNAFLDRYFYENVAIMNEYPDMNYVVYQCGFYNLQEYDRKVRNK